MATILPAILVDSYDEFKDRLEVLPPEAETISIDIMDGTFVNPSTWSDIEEVTDPSIEPMFELDLMVDDPLPYIEAWAAHPHTIRAIVHAELDTDIREILDRIRELKLESGIALLPATSIEEVEHLLNACDMVLIRGNEPGYSGQKLVPEMVDKIRLLRSEHPHLMINVDIGVNMDTIPELAKAGATHLSANSAIFKQESPQTAFEELQYLANQVGVDTPFSP